MSEHVGEHPGNYRLTRWLFRPAFSPSFLRLLLSIIVLLLLITNGIICYAAVYRPNQLQAEAAAAAAARAAKEKATAEAIAIQNAPPNLYTRIKSQPSQLTDQLNQPDSYGWQDQTHYDNNGKFQTQCVFALGSYYAVAAGGQYVECPAQATNFSNLLYQVQITIFQGHSGGLIFRCNQNDFHLCYAFRISTDGTYIFEKYISLNGRYVNLPITSGASAAIKQGLNQTNTLAVIARGSTFSLYVNGQYVASASDATYRSGEIGVFVESDASAVSAYFHNATVWTL
jgi:hypothetical protein